MNRVPILHSTDIDRAVSCLASGGLVALPTETVYGLGAAINKPEAINRIFNVKGRPTNHPLIVHVSDWDMALPLISEPLHEYVKALVSAFTPGPITFILPKSVALSDAITGGQNSVGIRIPNHPVTHLILQQLGVAVAAPSANKFGEVSPTSALHVFNDLNDVLNPDRDAIMDGGESEIGLESTIVDCRSDVPKILRPGAITEEMIREVVGTVESVETPDIRVSGALEKHYSPRAIVRIINSFEEVKNTMSQVGFIALEQVPTPLNTIRLAMPQHAIEFAQVLYDALRKADDLNLQEVYVVVPEDRGIGIAIRDRVTRAAH